jgi:hypothetical protein
LRARDREADVDLVDAWPACAITTFAANVKRERASLLETGAANSREEWMGKIEGGGTAARRRQSAHGVTVPQRRYFRAATHP